MPEINLDQAPKQQTTMTLTYNGKSFPLPPAVKFSVFRKMKALSQAEGDESFDLMEAVLTGILGDSKEAFLAEDPTFDELLFLMENLLQQYGEQVPKSEEPSTTSSDTNTP